MKQFLMVVALGLFLAATGCGGPRPTVGGTAGRLHSGSTNLSEIQVNVFRAEGTQFVPVGLGIPQPNGSFQLVKLDASGPVTLEAGEYRCTLESIGATVTIPAELTKPETTKLKVNWLPSDSLLDLDVPPLKPTR